MILISLIHGIDPVQQKRLPLHMVSRDRLRIIAGNMKRIPGTMRLHIVFCDQVNTVLITELINRGCIRIMAGTDRINVVALHRRQILNQLLAGYASSGLRAELMAVHTLKDNPLAIQRHDCIFHLKAAEAHALRDHLSHIPGGIRHLNLQII